MNARQLIRMELIEEASRKLNKQREEDKKKGFERPSSGGFPFGVRIIRPDDNPY